MLRRESLSHPPTRDRAFNTDEPARRAASSKKRVTSNGKNAFGLTSIGSTSRRPSDRRDRSIGPTELEQLDAITVKRPGSARPQLFHARCGLAGHDVTSASPVGEDNAEDAEEDQPVSFPDGPRDRRTPARTARTA
jgi:hypothetical protein